MIQVIFLVIVLRHQDFLLLTVPKACPAFVSPTKAEGEIWFAGIQYLVKRTLQQSSSFEPIMIIAKAVDAILTGQVSLSLSGFRKTQIIEPEIRRKVGLIMPLECGFRVGHIRPV